MMTKKILAGAAAMLLLGACQKDERPVPDPQQVRMTISSPQPQQVFRRGDTVRIKADVVYPGQLHGYEIRLTDSATGAVVHDIARHTHAGSFEIDETWVVSAPAPATISLSLITTIDHDGSDARRTVSFKLLP